MTGLCEAMGEVRIFTGTRGTLAQQARASVVQLLAERRGGTVTSEDVARLLGEAFGEALAECVLNGAGQEEVDLINDHSIAIYHIRLSPFFRQDRE